MHIINSKEELNEQLDAWRNAREHVALVPTMGNLHAGHASLVKLAREHAERVVVSVYVNPTQFGESEDYKEYPRTLERDTRRLKQELADVLFVPSDDVVFALVQPHAAVFGQKDYQQQLVIRYMAEDLNLPIRIITGETVREEDGLAMSSRNQYLDDEQRRVAPRLHDALDRIAAALATGNRNFADLEADAARRLTEAGFDVDYVAIRRAENLAEPDRDCDELVVLAAATLGAARLIDNVVVSV